MKKYFIGACVVSSLFIFHKTYPALWVKLQDAGYILEHEKDIAKEEPGTHNGGGLTTGHHFFSQSKDLHLVFKKRILHPGSAIGYHLQKEDEIYYIISGTGEMKMNGETLQVRTGDAILTRPGSSHSLKTIGNEDLVIIINYEKK